MIFEIKSAIVLKKGFESKPIYNRTFLRTKIKPYERKITTYFYNKKMP